jgi:TatD DNase family protein
VTQETFVRKASDVDERKSSKGIDFPPLPEALEVAIYDNHTHLEFQFVDELEPLSVTDHLDKAAAVGIKAVVQVGVTLESSKWSAGLAEREARVLAAVAIHPNEAPLYGSNAALDEAVAEIAELAQRPRVRAIGETGLDFFRTEGDTSIALQRRSFEQHIEIAKQNDIALMIHDRDAHQDVVATLKRVGAPEKVVFHCYSGDVELAEICAENGWYMSFAGNITIKRNQHLRDSLKIAPKELILIETDAPFLAPEPYRGRPNTSYLVPITARFMAEVRETEINEICLQLAANTEAVYGTW